MSTNNMFDRLSKNFLNSQFRQVDNVVWDLMSGAMGIMTRGEEIAVSSVGEDSEMSVTINPLASMSMAIPAYGQKLKADLIKVGDIVVDSSGKAYGWVSKIKDTGRFTITKVDGSETSIKPPKVNMIGFGEQDGLMVVKPIFDVTNGNTDGFKNMLMPMLMMGGNSSELESMIPMMLMTSAMGDSSGGNNMMQTMLMMKMMSGKGSF